MTKRCVFLYPVIQLKGVIRSGDVGAEASRPGIGRRKDISRWYASRSSSYIAKGDNSCGWRCRYWGRRVVGGAIFTCLPFAIPKIPGSSVGTWRVFLVGFLVGAFKPF